MKCVKRLTADQQRLAEENLTIVERVLRFDINANPCVAGLGYEDLYQEGCVCRVNDLSALRLPRVDVTIVLGNLIDNAMEACAGLSDPNRWVSIQILYSENMLSILIINPSNIVQINDGHIPTTKQDPLLHGFGIGNVKDILEKYHAEYLFTYDDGRFIFSADWPDIAEPSANTSILS